jgi:glycosyltransferase involved in cell wall biosynthesis
VVVLDACSDRCEAVASGYPVSVLQVSACNVGVARAAGAAALLARGARWLAFTDADSRVAPDWLSAQLALQADAVCGPVSVDDWSAHSPQARDAFYLSYLDSDGHRHVHGANLGMSAQAYQRAGGFPPLACSEDVALVELLAATGARIAWSAAPRVITSGRRDARVRGGFGDTLAALAQGEGGR